MRLIDADVAMEGMERVFFGETDAAAAKKRAIQYMKWMESIEIITCEHCRYWKENKQCSFLNKLTHIDDFCSWAKKEKNETD